MLAVAADWSLRALLPPDCQVATIRMGRGSFVIGRLSGLGLTLNSPYVSERHAELTILDDRVYVTDLDSRNGTYVNGKRIRRAPLGVGDLLLIGDVRLRLGRTSSRTPDDFSWSGDELTEHERNSLATQLETLLRDEPVSALLQPIVGLQDHSRIGYRAMLQSAVTGLESEARMQAAAQALAREGELNARLLRWRARAALEISECDFICIDAPPGINIEVELEPVLEALRNEAPDAVIQLAADDLQAYSLPVLNRLTAVLQNLNVGLVLQRFTREQLRFVQSARLQPCWVQLEPAQSPAAEGGATGSGLHLKALCDQLHHYGIQAGLRNISTRQELDVARRAGVDLAEGPLFGAPLRLERVPGTAILTSSQVASLLDAPTAT